MRRSAARILMSSLGMPIVHFTARLRESARGRLDRARAPWLWTHFRQAFPDALAVTLMPNHPHLLVDVVDVAAAYLTFMKVIAAFARGFPSAPPVWEPLPAPKILMDVETIAQHARYIALNPPRARLANDPLSWYWSTYRDLFGATADPWVNFDRVRRHLPSRLADVHRFHEFVSSDRSVDVAGRRPPVVASDAVLRGRPLDELLVAAAAATRGAIGDHRRRGCTRTTFVWLAAEYGWIDNRRLAELCDVTPQAIAKILRGDPPSSLAAARFCLGDPRLLWSVGGPTPSAGIFGGEARAAAR